MKFYFNYSIDCELPPEGQFGGPATWDIAEASTRGFIDVMTELGMREGASLFVYPDVAVKQRSLYREMADAGIETALHLNGLRYSRLQGDRAEWMGAMSRAEQTDALRMAKADIEDVTGRPCVGYRACYTSANNDTYGILEELGFEWTSTSRPGSHQPQVHACWSGAWRYPHHPSRVNRLITGDMELYEMPLADGVRTCFEGNPDRPLDPRAETPPEIAGENHEMFRLIIEENLADMARCDQPVRGLFVGSHNTNLFADRSTYQHRNLVAMCTMTRELAEADEYEFAPSRFATVKADAKRAGAF